MRAKLDPWESDSGVVRYYYKRWAHYLSPEQVLSYQSEYGEWLDSPRPSVSVYFDSEFWLHIDGCLDPGLRSYLEERMAGWCDWALAEYDRDHPRLVGARQLGTLLDEHAKPIKPGFWQISHEGVYVNLDEQQMAHFRWSGTISYDRVEKRFVVRTGYPRLDRVMEGIVRDKGLDTPMILSAGMRERRMSPT